jgi:hypothetical protein
MRCEREGEYEDLKDQSDRSPDRDLTIKDYERLSGRKTIKFAVQPQNP